MARRSARSRCRRRARPAHARQVRLHRCQVERSRSCCRNRRRSTRRTASRSSACPPLPRSPACFATVCPQFDASNEREGRRSTLALERGGRKLCSMRWSVLGVLVLSACARSQAEDAALAPPIPAAQVRASPRGEIDALAGYVTAHEGGVLKLDSGGPTPIELRLDPKARVTRDG